MCTDHRLKIRRFAASKTAFPSKACGAPKVQDKEKTKAGTVEGDFEFPSWTNHETPTFMDKRECGQAHHSKNTCVQVVRDDGQTGVSGSGLRSVKGQQQDYIPLAEL